MTQKPEPASPKGLHLGDRNAKPVPKPKDEPAVPKRDSPPISGQQIYGMQDDPA